MAIQFSEVVTSREYKRGDALSAKSIRVSEFGRSASPVSVLDHFRLRDRPFDIHCHAGFSAVSYLFEDSHTGSRGRDSLGNDWINHPGGIAWTQAGSGLVHEDFGAEPGREVHGVQVFVNLSAKNKFTPPKLLRLSREEIPDWRNAHGDRVRVAVGSFEGVTSPLVPVEPFTLLDAFLKSEISLDVKDGCNTMLYVLAGRVRVRCVQQERLLSDEQALVLHGEVGRASVRAMESAHVLVLSGAEIREPMVVKGYDFIMNSQGEIDAAAARYRSGAMGRLLPLAQG